VNRLLSLSFFAAALLIAGSTMMALALRVGAPFAGAEPAGRAWAAGSANFSGVVASGSSAPVLPARVIQGEEAPLFRGDGGALVDLGVAVAAAAPAPGPSPAPRPVMTPAPASRPARAIAAETVARSLPEAHPAQLAVLERHVHLLHARIARVRAERAGCSERRTVCRATRRVLLVEPLTPTKG